MNSEALRLLDELHAILLRYVDGIIARHAPVITAEARNFDKQFAELRALLSAQEPTAKHFRQALRE